MVQIALEKCDDSIHDLVKFAQTNEAIIFTQNDEPMFILGTIDIFEWKILSLLNNQNFLKHLEQAKAHARAEKSVALPETRRPLNISLESEHGLAETKAGKFVFPLPFTLSKKLDLDNLTTLHDEPESKT